MIKKITAVLYVLIIVLMATASVIENYKGTPFTHLYIYGSWWFSLTWALLTGFGTAYILKQKVRKWDVLLLHLSFIVILVGALLTHTLSYSGIVHIRGDQPTNQYTEMISMKNSEAHTLPFYVRLDKFDVKYHSGTEAAADYTTHFSIIDGPNTVHAKVSMNHVFNYRGVRFYQASYDTDSMGSYLSVNSDPWGVTVTYTGYAMLFFALLWLLIDPKGTFRRMLASPLLKKGALTIVLLTILSFIPQPSRAATTIDKATATSFGNLFVNYNNRICPLQTLAIDFTNKIYGKRYYGDATAEQVLMSWIFYGNEWNNEPVVKVKNSEMRSRFGLPEYTCLNAFFHDGEYILGRYAAEYQQGQTDGFHKACAEMDSKITLIMQLQQGSLLTILPDTRAGKTTWYSPADSLPPRLGRTKILFFKNIFPMLYSQIASGQEGNTRLLIDKLALYQRKNAGSSLPSARQVKAERIYNAIPLATVLFMVNLTLGLIALLLTIRRMTAEPKPELSARQKLLNRCLLGMLTLSFLTLSFTLALRWLISGNIPLSNGYESMLAVAWFVQLLSIAAYHKAHIVLVFGFLLSGFFLLVSHISQMDPAIGQMMPVLNSPLLSIHVSIIMMSYALLALTFICGLTAVIIMAADRLHHTTKTIGPRANMQVESLQVLSRLFLYPAVTTMGLGIFIGAIWANISWGTYWSWDPKETWALITFMIYAVVLHTQSLPALSKPGAYHLYMIIAFLSIIMTYFGVNYVLGGMHSYA